MNLINEFENKEKKIIIILILSIIFFLFFDYSIASFFDNINNQTKSLFGTLTHLGDSLYFFVTTGLVWVAIKLTQNKNKITVAVGDISIFIFLTILLSGVSTQFFKHIIGRPRPFLYNGYEKISLDLFSFDSKWHSFPSGHTATIFAFIFCLLFLFPKIKNFLITIAIIIASTRVIVGAHFISDIFGGVLVAYISSIYMRNRFIKKEKLFLLDGDTHKSNDEVTKIFNFLKNLYKNIFSIYINFNFYLKTLIVTLILSILFFILPNLDITVSGLFFGQDGNFILLEHDYLVILIRKTIMPIFVLLMFFLPIAAVFKQIIFKEKLIGISLKDWIYLYSCLTIGTGIIVNLIFKNLWGRARPNDTIEFGGESPFTIPWLNVDYCSSNCSFVSGDVSLFTLSLAILIVLNKSKWNLYAYLSIGTISLLRIMQGDHFLSDTIMSFIITLLVIRVLHSLFKNFPDDLNFNFKLNKKK